MDMGNTRWGWLGVYGRGLHPAVNPSRLWLLLITMMKKDFNTVYRQLYVRIYTYASLCVTHRGGSVAKALRC